MCKFTEYRGMAARYRREAEAAQLPEERERLLKAADKWDAIADETELAEKQLDRVRPDRKR